MSSFSKFAQSQKNVPIKSLCKNTFIKNVKASVQSINLDKNSQQQNYNLDSAYNILFIDKQIREKLQSKMTSVDELRKELDRNMWILQNCNPTGINKIDLDKQTFSLKNRIRDLSLMCELSLYTLRTSDILERYKKLCKQEKTTIVFGQKPQVKSSQKNSEMSDLIIKYLNIAKDYIEIDMKVFKKYYSGETCDCKETYISNDQEICIDCHKIMSKFDKNDTNKVDETMPVKKNIDKSLVHLLNAFDRHQGINKANIPDNVISTLRKDCSHHRIPHDDLTPYQTYNFLSENGFSEYYKYYMIIWSIITGKSLPNLQKYRKELIERFTKAETVFNEHIKPSLKRDNSLNVNYMLFRLLQQCGYQCKISDFVTLKTFEKLKEYDQIWEKMITILNWKRFD